jgi:hypothetical protein
MDDNNRFVKVLADAQRIRQERQARRGEVVTAAQMQIVRERERLRALRWLDIRKVAERSEKQPHIK